MARGGVTRTEVAEARLRVSQRGVNPSIDAIRAELGHTGSKTTISRHLKDIEQREATRLDDEALLSDPIKQLIAQMARQLKVEASELADLKIEAHQKEVADLRRQLADAQQQSESFRMTNQSLTHDLSDAKAQLSELGIKGLVHAERIEGLEHALSEKNKQIESLEVKHTHARESLEHYRASVKEQREQDHRRHEQQLQQYQAEQRHLQQSLVVKQDELTQATSEQTRLFAELRESRKQLDQLNSTYKHEQREHRQCIESHASLVKELDIMKGHMATLQAELESHESVLIRMRDMEVELAAKNGLLKGLGKLS